ncbi:type II toxin-antitoxin system RelE/ParE family toxin [Mucilaginibacter sp. AW1-3]
MSFEVIAIKNFSREAKRLVKKYPSLKTELGNLFDSLESEPTQGKSIGNNCYKIRLSISSKGKGKSGGARVITHVYIKDSKVFILSIYDKSEQANITDNQIIELLKEI